MVIGERDKMMYFAFECQTMIIIKKFKALTDWGVLKQLFEMPHIFVVASRSFVQIWRWGFVTQFQR